MNTEFDQLDAEQQAKIIELVKKKQRDYHKQWRDRNKDKLRQYRHDYYIRKVMEEIKEVKNGE